jgi:hypothetical protein
MMSARHLSCGACRVRVLAQSPEIDLLEGGCPICGAALRPATSAREVIGFRWFDLAALSAGGLSGAPAIGQSLDRGATLPREPAAQYPAPRRSPGVL